MGGYILEKKHFKLPEELFPVAIALLIGGILFIVVERWLKGRDASSDTKSITPGHVAIAVGIGQLIATSFSRQFPLRHYHHIHALAGTEPPFGYGIFFSSQHSNDAGGERLQDFQSHSSPCWRIQIPNGGPSLDINVNTVHENWTMVFDFIHCRGHRIFHCRQMAVALRTRPIRLCYSAGTVLFWAC